MQTLEIKHTKLTLSQWFWLFMLGSFLGCCYEDIVLSINKGHIIFKRGLIFEPIIPIYGLAGCAIIYIFNNIESKSKIITIFIIGLVGAFLEYIFSFIQENVWGTISWDYTYVPLNFDGRTSLQNFFIIGIGGYLFLTYVYPWFLDKLSKIPKKIYLILTWFMFIFVLFDILLSNAATYRQAQRRKGIEATNCIQEVLDKYYPDEVLEKIFTNSRVPNK